MRVLELFCGTKSIGKHCARNSIEVVSLDVDPKCAPTHLSDICVWDYKAYPTGHFDIVWSSPPCTHYSVLRTTGGPRDIEGANRIVQRTLEIIAYFAPKVWFLENPGTGMLKHQPFMQSLPFVDVHYCKYGYPYRKWTRIWTNLKGYRPRPLCRMDCAAMVTDSLTGRLRHRGTFGGAQIYQAIPRQQRYSIPQELVEELFDSVCNCSHNMSRDITLPSHSLQHGCRRFPTRIRAISIEDPSDVKEYASISAATKDIQDDCPQNNVRAALSRCLAKNNPLAGRRWYILRTKDAQVQVDTQHLT
jgi:hypothetical protein